MGCLDLAMPVYNPHYLKYVQAVLQSICACCMRPRVHKPDEPPSSTTGKRGICYYASRFKDQTRCAHPSCGVLHPTYKRCANTYIRRIWSARAKADLRAKMFESDPSRFKRLTSSLRAVDVHDAFRVMENIGLADQLRRMAGSGPGVVKPLTRLLFDSLPVSPVSLRPTVVLSKGSKLRSESEQTIVYQVIVKENAKLVRMMLARARSAAASSTNPQLAVNPLTSDFMSVAKFREAYDALQAVVSMFVSASARAHNPNISRRRRSGEARRSLSSYLTGKTGLLRSNVQGKRGNNGARTVVTGDPHIPVDVVTVPQFIATRLHRVERVTRFNLAQMRKRVLLGPGKIGGALKIILPPASGSSSTRAGKRSMSYALWRTDRERIANTLAPGYAVVRYLESGDRVLFNRQPSLSRKSMMAFRVMVVPDHRDDDESLAPRVRSYPKRMPRTVFGMHLSVTAAFNADFDGDEMNIHMLNSHEAEAEGRYLVSVSHQVTNELNSKTTLCIVQDSVLGAYLLSRSDQWLTKSEYMQLVSQVTCPDTPISCIPPPGRPARGRSPDLWSGRQVLSSFMPPLSLESGSFRMIAGKIIDGCITKRILNGGFQSILYKTSHYCGDERAVRLAEDLQRVTRVFLSWRAGQVAIGADNLMAHTKEEVQQQLARANAVREACFWGERIIQIGLRENVSLQAIEADAQAHFGSLLRLDRVERGAEGPCREERDALRAVVESGSKGSWINLAQMRTCVGQQSQNGSRLGVLREDSPDDPRLSAHEPFPVRISDVSVRAGGLAEDPIDIIEPWRDPADAALRVPPRARGFVASSFREGLNASEFFYHSMSGRVGVIDTSCKTAESGYLQRKLSKALEDLVLGYDYTVRDVSSEAIVSFLYGEGDSLDPKRLCTITRGRHAHLMKVPDKRAACRCSVCGLRAKLSNELRDSIGEIERDSSTVEEKYDMPFDPECLWRQVRARTRRGTDLASKGFIEHHALSFLHFLRRAGEPNADKRSGCVVAVGGGLLTGTITTHLPLRISVAYYMCPSRISPASKQHVLEFIERGKHHFYRAKACPGDSVGASAATSLGASLTQSTLNTFHFAGVAEKRAMTLGIPRYKELVNASTNISNAYVDICLVQNTAYPDAEASLRCALWPQVRSGDSKASLHEGCAREVSVLWESTSFEVIKSKKRARRATTALRSNVELRLQMTLQVGSPPANEVCRRIRRGAPWGSDPTLPSLIMNHHQKGEKTIIVIMVNHPLVTATGAPDAARFLMETFEGMVLDPAYSSRGVHIGAKTAWACQDGSIRVLMSGSGRDKHSHKGGGGASLSRAMQRLWAAFTRRQVPFDFQKSYSNDVSAVCSTLGVETARSILEREFLTVLCSDGTYISKRHVVLASDFMLSRGVFSGMTRHDYKRNLRHRGALARACFEQPLDVLVDAAASGERDPIRTASARVMVGRRIYNGTGCFSVLTDPQYARVAANYGKSAVPASSVFGRRGLRSNTNTHTVGTRDAAPAAVSRSEAEHMLRSDMIDEWSSSKGKRCAVETRRCRKAKKAVPIRSSSSSIPPTIGPRRANSERRRPNPTDDSAHVQRVMREYPGLYAYENLMRAAHTSFAQSRSQCTRSSRDTKSQQNSPDWLDDEDSEDFAQNMFEPRFTGTGRPKTELRVTSWDSKGMLHQSGSTQISQIDDGCFGDKEAFGIESALQCAYKASKATLQM